MVYLQERWEESENGLIALIRTIVEKVTGFFSETEQAKVVKQLKLMDPSFRLTDFQRTLTNYIVPEVVDAYIKNDAKVLKSGLVKHLIMCGRPITNNLSNRVFSLIAECWISGG